MREHKNASILKRHAPTNWSVLNISELSTLTVGAEDVEKTAYIADDGTGNPTTYVLVNYDPSTWKPSVSGTGGSSGSASNLNDLGDVEIVSPANGDIIRYDAGTSKYKNVPLPVSVSAKTIQTTTADTVSSDNTTFINLPELTITLEANSVYEIEGFLPLQQSNTNGYALQFVTPSDSKPFYYITPAITPATSANQGHSLSVVSGEHTVTTGSVSAANTTMLPHIKSIVETVSAGEFTINFRYNNTNLPATTTILAGARIVWEKIR